MHTHASLRTNRRQEDRRETNTAFLSFIFVLSTPAQNDAAIAPLANGAPRCARLVSTAATAATLNDKKCPPGSHREPARANSGASGRRTVTVFEPASQNERPRPENREFRPEKHRTRELRAVQRWPTSAILEKTPYCCFGEHGGAHGGFHGRFFIQNTAAEASKHAPRDPTATTGFARAHAATRAVLGHHGRGATGVFCERTRRSARSVLGRH